MSGRASNMPATTSTAVRAHSNPATAPATRSDSGSSSSTSLAYTGMNDAERTPSPIRFCRRFGIRSAALKASATAPTPR